MPTPRPVDGELLVQVSAAGINFADLLQVEDTYLAPTSLPFVPGVEVVGQTADQRRVAAIVPSGGYAEQAVVASPMAVEVPETVSDEQALGVLVQGVTAWHLLRTSAAMREGESVVVHAAGGGVGTQAIQLARRWGAGRVIAAASTDEKRNLALELGADAAIDSRAPNLTEALEEANLGRRVDIVLESSGGRVLDASVEALAPFGRLITYGYANGLAAQSLEPIGLLRRSRGVVGFWLAHCFRRPEMLTEPIRKLLSMIGEGSLRVVSGGRYSLAEARQAHLDLRGRATSGKLVLTANGAAPN
ncbi:MAG: quinone oxidoreductase family protein [Solirubrobacterales bacterium]